MNNYMKIANEEATYGVNVKDGGPFGAVIIDKMGNIIAKAHNTVLKDKDPTAHAEINVIRKACKIMNTNDLSNLILYTSCEPCPMCLSAIIWANIKEVYYACSRNDAKDVGFRDDDIYEFIKGNNNMIKLKQIDRQICIDTMESYKKDNGSIY